MPTAGEFYPHDGEDKEQSRVADALNRKFETIIQSAWTGDRPKVRDTLDPGVAGVLRKIALVQDALNAREQVSDADLEEAKAEIICELRDAELYMAAVTLTGKLRLVVRDGAEIVQDVLDEDDIAALQEALPKPSRDVFDAYYPVDGFMLRICQPMIQREVDELYRSGQLVSYQIALGFTIEGDDTKGPLFSMRPDDVELINPKHLVQEGARLFLSEYLPQALEAIDQLIPDDCGDDDIIFQGLHELVIEIPNGFCEVHGLSLNDLLSILDTYLSQRASLDKEEPYQITVKGHVMGYDAQMSSTEKLYDTPQDLFVHDLEPGFIPIGFSKTGDRFGVCMEGRVAVPERRGGRTPVFIPIQSILGHASSTRASFIVTDGDVLVEHTDEVHELVASDGKQFDDDDTQEAAEMIREDIEGLEEVFGPLNDLDTTLVESFETRFERLVELEKEMTIVLRSLQKLCQQPLKTDEGLKWAKAAIETDLSVLLTRLDSESCTFAIRGEGLLSSHPLLKHEANKNSIVIEGYDYPKTGNYTSEVIGKFNKYYSVVQLPSEAASSTLVVKLGFDQSENSELTIRSDTGLPMLTLGMGKHAVIDLSRDGLEWEIVELARMRSQQIAVEGLAEVLKDSGGLQHIVFINICEEITQLRSSDFSAPLESGDMLIATAGYLKKHPELLSRAAEYIKDIFGTSSYIGITGECYTDDYECLSQGISGTLIDVVDHFRWKKDPEIYLVLEARNDGAIYYVPLSAAQAIEM